MILFSGPFPGTFRMWEQRAKGSTIYDGDGMEPGGATGLREFPRASK
jgi:hypothetical protein